MASTPTVLLAPLGRLPEEVICEVTGEIVSSDSEEWRHDCECRWVSDLIDKDRPAAVKFFDGVRKKRGEEAWSRLFDDVTILRKGRREREAR